MRYFPLTEENIEFYKQLEKEYAIAEVEQVLKEMGYDPSSISRIAPKVLDNINRDVRNGKQKMLFLKLYTKYWLL